MNLEQKKFEEWKRRHGKLDEGFLDGNVMIDQWVLDYDVDREYYVFPVAK